MCVLDLEGGVFCFFLFFRCKRVCLFGMKSLWCFSDESRILYSIEYSKNQFCSIEESIDYNM